MMMMMIVIIIIIIIIIVMNCRKCNEMLEKIRRITADGISLELRSLSKH